MAEQTGMRIELAGVSRRFVAGGSDIWAVRDVTITVDPGEFLAVIGRSGSGKTTLLNLIAGLERPTSGAIRLDGEEITAYSDARLTELRRRRIGFIFQSFGLLPLLSALENVELALRIAGASRRERGRRAHEVLELMGLAKRANHRPYELSGGEQQRVAIARAIANRPALILADEPTGELDSVTGLTIFRALRDIARAEGITILTSTHDHMVMELATRVEELADGRLLHAGQRTLFQYATSRDRRTPIAVTVRADELDRPLPPPIEQDPGHVEPMTAPVEAATVADAGSWAQPAVHTPPEPAPASTNASEPELAADIARWAPPERRG